MNIDDTLRRLGETLREPEIDIETAQERVRATARRLRDDPLEARRIDDLAKLVDRSEKDYRLGQEALQKQDFGAAERHFRRAAQDGNDEAAYWLGLLLEMRSIRQRLKDRPDKARKLAEEARQWRLRAQESGIAEALDETRSNDVPSNDVPPQLPAKRHDGARRDREQANAHTPGDDKDEAGTPARRVRYVVGIEVQPYRFTAVLADGTGVIISERAGDLFDMQAEAVVPALAASVREIVTSTFRQGFPAGQVALAVQLGGPVDTMTGTVHFFSKHPPGYPGGHSEFKWEDFPLGPRLQQETGFPTIVLNDAVAFAERERWVGVGQQTGDFVVMLVREGVGGAVVSDGEHFKGPVEIGNFRYSSANFEPSDTDQYGVLEVDGGITGVTESASEHAGQVIPDLETAAALADKHGPGRAASAAFLSAGVAIARGLSYLVHFAGPSHVVLYAPAVMLRSECNAGKNFLGQVKNFQESVAFKAYRNCELVLRPDEPNNGAEGAALAALSRCFQEDPPAVRIGTGALR